MTRDEQTAVIMLLDILADMTMIAAHPEANKMLTVKEADLTERLREANRLLGGYPNAIDNPTNDQSNPGSNGNEGNAPDERLKASDNTQSSSISWDQHQASAKN